MNLFRRKLFSRGFTAMELLVVLSIAGILMAIVFTSFSEARANARDKARLADLAQIKLALELYKEQNGYYPKEGDGYSGNAGSPPPLTGMICKTCNTGRPINDVIEQFLGNIPEDPRHNGTTYRYYYDGAHACGGEPNVAILFARTMETNGYRHNVNDVISEGDCTSLGGEAVSTDLNAHVIILGPSAG